MNRLNRSIERFCHGCALLGVGLLAGCAVLTVIDVLSRRSIGWTVPGMVDLTQLLVMGGVFLCIPYAFARRAHVEVELVHERLPRHARVVLTWTWSLVALLFLAMVLWAVSQAGLGSYRNDDQSQTIGLPMVLYWVPIVFGIGLSALVCLGQILDRTPAGGGRT